MDKGADINMKDIANTMTPMHHAIKSKHLSACKLILGYKEISSQSIESGSTLARAVDSSEIRSLLEKKLKSRRKVILVRTPHLFLPISRVLWTQN